MLSQSNLAKNNHQWCFIDFAVRYPCEIDWCDSSKLMQRIHEICIDDPPSEEDLYEMGWWLRSYNSKTIICELKGSRKFLLFDLKQTIILTVMKRLTLSLLMTLALLLESVWVGVLFCQSVRVVLIYPLPA